MEYSGDDADDSLERGLSRTLVSPLEGALAAAG